MQVVGIRVHSRITQVPDSLFAGSQRFFDKSNARSRRLQNSPPAAAQTVEGAYLPRHLRFMSKKHLQERSKGSGLLASKMDQKTRKLK